MHSSSFIVAEVGVSDEMTEEVVSEVVAEVITEVSPLHETSKHAANKGKNKITDFTSTQIAKLTEYRIRKQEEKQLRCRFRYRLRRNKRCTPGRSDRRQIH